MDSTREQLKEYLVEEGYRPTVDEDGHIRFKIEGEKFVVWREENDDDYLRVMLIYSGDDGVAIERCLSAANELNRKFKAVKTTCDPTDGSMWFTYEAFYQHARDATPCLHRVVRMLVDASDDFFATIRAGAQEVS